MKQYRVMKRGHYAGFNRLEFGATVTAEQLGVPEAQLDTLAGAGILKAAAASPTPTPVTESQPVPKAAVRAQKPKQKKIVQPPPAAGGDNGTDEKEEVG